MNFLQTYAFLPIGTNFRGVFVQNSAVLGEKSTRRVKISTRRVENSARRVDFPASLGAVQGGARGKGSFSGFL